MALTERLESLRTKHAELQRELDQEIQRPMPSPEIIARIKRAKLRVKDQMADLTAH